MAIDWQQIEQQMLAAAAKVFNTDWPLVADYAEIQFGDYAEELRLIQQLLEAGSIDREEAADIEAMEGDSIKSVLLCVEGITELAVEQALNAAIGVVRGSVNAALGFALLL